jgi:hypothetical protein
VAPMVCTPFADIPTLSSGHPPRPAGHLVGATGRVGSRFCASWTMPDGIGRVVQAIRDRDPANPVAHGGPFRVAMRHEDHSLPTVLSYGHGPAVGYQSASCRAIGGGSSSSSSDHLQQ